MRVDVREQAVVLGGVEILSDEDRDDERVNGDNTGHDDGDQTLRGTLEMVIGRLDDRFNTFMIRSGRKVPTPAIPMPDLAVP